MFKTTTRINGDTGLAAVEIGIKALTAAVAELQQGQKALIMMPDKDVYAYLFPKEWKWKHSQQIVVIDMLGRKHAENQVRGQNFGLFACIDLVPYDVLLPGFFGDCLNHQFKRNAPDLWLISGTLQP